MISSTASRWRSSSRLTPGVNSISARVLGRERQCRPISRFSSTVACSNSSMFWKVRAMPRPAMVWGATRVMSSPANISRPPVGS